MIRWLFIGGLICISTAAFAAGMFSNIQVVNNSPGPGGDLCDGGATSGSCNSTQGFLLTQTGAKLFAR